MKTSGFYFSAYRDNTYEGEQNRKNSVGQFFQMSTRTGHGIPVESNKFTWQLKKLSPLKF